MKCGCLLFSIFFSFSCLAVYANETDEVKAKILREWKSAIKREIQAEVHRQFSPMSKQFAYCQVMFNVNRDGSISDIQTSRANNILFSGLVYAVVSRFKGNPLLKFPEETTEGNVKFEFGLSSNSNERVYYGDFDSTVNKKIPFVNGKRVPEK